MVFPSWYLPLIFAREQVRLHRKSEVRNAPHSWLSAGLDRADPIRSTGSAIRSTNVGQL